MAQRFARCRLALCPDFYMNSEIDAEVDRAFKETLRVLQHLARQSRHALFRTDTD
jgi:hypothetical protein